MAGKKEKTGFITGNDLAKKSHVIKHNKHFFDIKEGEKIENYKIPEMFLSTLKTEGII